MIGASLQSKVKEVVKAKLKIECDIDKKQVEFTKDTIKITNNDGMEIKMDDKKGISITSDKDIEINADKDIKMQSIQKKVNVSAQKEVMFKQGASSYIKLKWYNKVVTPTLIKMI